MHFWLFPVVCSHEAGMHCPYLHTTTAGCRGRLVNEKVKARPHQGREGFQGLFFWETTPWLVNDRVLYAR